MKKTPTTSIKRYVNESSLIRSVHSSSLLFDERGTFSSQNLKLFNSTLTMNGGTHCSKLCNNDEAFEQTNQEIRDSHFQTSFIHIRLIIKLI